MQMKRVILVLVLISLALIDCKERKKNQVYLDTLTVPIISEGIKLESPIDSSILQVDTVLILGKRFLALYKTNDSLFIIRDNDTIFNSIWDNNGFEFKDFDMDGYKDLLINHISNIGDIYDILLFNPRDFTFTLVDNMTSYPSPELLIHNYYYSYHRAGCADMNWISNLFKIENFKTILLGEIYGQGCDSDPKKVDIYKINSNDFNTKMLLMTFPIDTINKHSDYKWGFIKDFWTNNYNKFKE